MAEQTQGCRDEPFPELPTDLHPNSYQKGLGSSLKTQKIALHPWNERRKKGVLKGKFLHGFDHHQLFGYQRQSCQSTQCHSLKSVFMCMVGTVCPSVTITLFESKYVYFLLPNYVILLTCGMMVSLERRSCSPKLAMLMPSITIFPSAASRIRKIPKAKDDFPAPVLPTIPTYK